MLFVGVDGLDGESGGIKQVQNGVFAATFVYPLCVEQAVDIGSKILQDPKFVPEKTYTVPSRMILPDAAPAK